MNLSDGSRRQRGWIYKLKNLIKGQSDLFPNNGLHLLKGKTFDLILKFTQCFGILSREQFWSRRQELTQLDEGRSQRFASFPQSLGTSRIVLIIVFANQVQAHVHIGPNFNDFEQVSKAILKKDTENLLVTTKVPVGLRDARYFSKVDHAEAGREELAFRFTLLKWLPDSPKLRFASRALELPIDERCPL